MPLLSPKHQQANFLQTAFTTNATALLGRYFVAHPNYGINGGSPSATYYNKTLVSNVGNAYGMQTRFIILRNKMKFTITNLEAFPIVVVLVPIPGLQASTFSTSNFGSNLANSVGAKSMTLQQTGITGSIKTMTITWDTAKVEGLPVSALLQTSYWNQQNVVGGIYQLCYLQAYDPSATNTFTTGKGLGVALNATYDVMPVAGINVDITA